MYWLSRSIRNAFVLLFAKVDWRYASTSSRSFHVVEGYANFGSVIKELGQ